MQGRQQQTPGEQITLPGTFNLLVILLSAHATCLRVFLRYGFGSEALGANGLGAFLLILAYAGFSNSPEMLTYFWLWFAALIAQRCRTGVLAATGRREHSRYNGWPWLTGLVTRNELAAKAAEGPLCLIIGAILCEWSEQVGYFVMFGMVSLTGLHIIDRIAIEMQIRRMRDAEIEMQWAAEWFRSSRGR